MLKNIDVSSAMTRVAERKIEEAMRAGKFDNLEGAGKPLDLEPMPADENARMMWWAMRLLKRNDVLPDEVRYRKSINALRGRILFARDESGVRALVAEINATIARLNSMGTNIRPTDQAPLDVEAEVARWRTHRHG